MNQIPENGTNEFCVIFKGNFLIDPEFDFKYNLSMFLTLSYCGGFFLTDHDPPQ